MSGKDTVDGFQYLPLFALCLSFKVEGPCTRALPLSSRTGVEVDDKRGKPHANNQTRARLYAIRSDVKMVGSALLSFVANVLSWSEVRISVRYMDSLRGWPTDAREGVESA